MRLTLRTLLAYVDDRLSPANAREIGQKITNSPFATGIIAAKPCHHRGCSHAVAGSFGEVPPHLYIALHVSIAYAVDPGVMGVAGTVVNFLFLVRPMIEQA